VSNRRPTPRRPGTAIKRGMVIVSPVHDALVLEAVRNGLQRAREALTAEGWALGPGPVRIGAESYRKQ
jgi:hypothetical protein